MDYILCCTYALFDSLLYRLKYDSYDVSSERNCAGNTNECCVLRYFWYSWNWTYITWNRIDSYFDPNQTCRQGLGSLFFLII